MGTSMLEHSRPHFAQSLASPSYPRIYIPHRTRLPSHTVNMSTKKFKLLCLENPLLDIQGKGDESMLQQYGLKLDDTLLAEPHQMDLYDDLIKNHDAKLIPGGAAQNTARGVEYMIDRSTPTGKCGVVITGHHRTMCTHLAAAN